MPNFPTQICHTLDLFLRPLPATDLEPVLIKVERILEFLYLSVNAVWKGVILLRPGTWHWVAILCLLPPTVFFVANWMALGELGVRHKHLCSLKHQYSVPSPHACQVHKLSFLLGYPVSCSSSPGAHSHLPLQLSSSRGRFHSCASHSSHNQISHH